MLYMNEGKAFTERSVDAGVNWGDWGWGTDAVDFDHDGWLDIIATNGFAGPLYETDPTHFWLNQQDGNFTDAAGTTGLIHDGQGRGLVTFDADNDGDRDVIIACNNQPLAYFRNDLTGTDAKSLTLFFDTSGEPGIAPDGVGTRVEIDAGGSPQIRYLDGGDNFQSQSELSVHFGLGPIQTIDEIRIHWLDGRMTTLVGVEAGRYTITARFACPIDWNVDGVLDLADINGWLDDFITHHPQADLTTDGAFDLADLTSFVTLFTTGCQ